MEGESFTLKKFKPVLVRPAAETYDGIYFLTNLDQNMAYLVEMVFCYKGDGRKRSENVSEVMKQALSKVLLHFYPLAGSLMMSSDGKLMVKCTGVGVPFVEAIADHEINVLGDVTMLDPLKQRKLVHTFDEGNNVLELPMLTVQVTMFKCGGFVLGVGMNHCMTDLTSLMEFIRSWAKIAQGLPLNILPSLDRSTVRSRQPPKVKYPHHEFEKNKEVQNDITLGQEEMVYRSFYFNREKLSQLRKIAMEDGVINNCTYFAVLSAFLWRTRTGVLKMASNQQMKLLIAVDVRSKLNPPLPEGSFFNGVMFTCCICSAGELISKPLSFAVTFVQEAIELVTEEFVRSAIDYYEVTRSRTALMNTFMISKWTQLPLYDADFGWGDPTRVGPATIDQNWAVFVPNAKEKHSLIVSLCLPVSAMKIFQDLIHSNVRLKSSI